jgi:hypothetical protein
LGKIKNRTQIGAVTPTKPSSIAAIFGRLASHNLGSVKSCGILRCRFPIGMVTKENKTSPRKDVDRARIEYWKNTLLRSLDATFRLIRIRLTDKMMRY